MIKQLLNLVIAEHRDLSVSRRSRYFAPGRPIIVKTEIEYSLYPPFFSRRFYALLLDPQLTELTNRAGYNFRYAPEYNIINGLGGEKSNYSTSPEYGTIYLIKIWHFLCNSIIIYAEREKPTI